MFSLIEVGTFPGSWHKVHRLYANPNGKGNVAICKVVDWGFSSCACKLLQEFGIYPPKNVDVDAMFEFLNGVGKDKGEYMPKEYYFMLSGNQLTRPISEVRLLHDMVNHPCVQQIDQFTNKSHESKGVKLYRYSAAKDFVFPMEDK